MITQPQATTQLPDPDEERRRIQTARLLAYRDDGPLATALKGSLGRLLPPVPATVVAVLAIAALAYYGVLTDGASLLAPVAVLLVLVLPTAGRDHLGRLDWLTPPLLRGAEFMTIILLGLAEDTPKWLLFVLIYVIGYHTYDTVYRTRQGIWPPAWVYLAGLGWEVRLLILGLAAAAGWLTLAAAVLTVYLLALFAIESITSWVRLDKASAQAQADQDLEQSPEEAAEQITGEAEQG
ncbi:hypothetical protein GCM10010116_15460 [Microbispora rosea subsp. aerata]|nr:DUF5941 domain-containing protein [Microbispora rosea]GGO07668.1 hypothetical protein GCM10010116_15460 [Microbispora rosea subsp. aerata]GIH53245.1 hypothetical protein Mro02_01590 [Microbispora rosea subsp. aerata]GLJ83843.1 hypothetical protein GCM10017588_25710 [Microbispora rosea subsp. aerata]